MGLGSWVIPCDTIYPTQVNSSNFYFFLQTLPDTGLIIHVYRAQQIFSIIDILVLNQPRPSIIIAALLILLCLMYVYQQFPVPFSFIQHSEVYCRCGEQFVNYDSCHCTQFVAIIIIYDVPQLVSEPNHYILNYSNV